MATCAATLLLAGAFVMADPAPSPTPIPIDPHHKAPINSIWRAKDGRRMRVMEWTRGADGWWARLDVLPPHMPRERRSTTMKLERFTGRTGWAIQRKRKQFERYSVVLTTRPSGCAPRSREAAMPVEWVDNEHDSRARLECGVVLTVLTDVGRADWYSYPISPVSGRGPHPTREAAKSAAEAEARRLLWAGLKALGAPDIKRAIAAWFSPVRQQDTEGLFDLVDYEADMRRAFDAGMEPDNG